MPIIEIDKIYPGMKQRFQIGELNLILIEDRGKIYLVENRCGHFGASLDNAKVKNGTITCTQHFVRFDLLDGRILNETVEQCDPLKVYPWEIDNKQIVLHVD